MFQHQPQEFHHHHLKTHLFSQQPQLDSTPLLPTTAAETLPQPIKKRAYSGAGRRTAAMRNAGVGEIVEVQGGHILRATGRKDRHSKVCTAKGPRDRRVRLAAQTAIQFYDVQDRLGYDRPSKAVDWLMNKAKAAIDELDELPAWKPSATAMSNKKSKTPPGDGDSAALAAEEGEGMYNVEESSDLLPPSLDSDAIADTIKSFFPLNGAVSAAQQHTQFQPYTSPDLISRRGGSHSQDLKLSLQSFQDPMLIGFDNNNNNNNPYAHQRLIGDGGGGGFMLIPPHTPQQHQHQHQQQPPLLFGGSNGQTAAHLFHQRGPLQSSNTPSSVRAWMGDYSIGSSSTSAHDFHQAVSVHPVSLSGIGYASSSGGFSGFCIPARIQGDDEEEHDGIPNKPSSASSGSRH